MDGERVNRGSSGGNIDYLKVIGAGGPTATPTPTPTATPTPTPGGVQKKEAEDMTLLYVKGVVVDSWTANQNLGSASPDNATLTSRTKTGVSIASGDEIKVEANKDGGEYGRVDCLEIY